jgi:hypothetical protein
VESIFRVGGALLIGAALIGGAFYIEHRGIADSQAATSPALVVANDTVRSVQTSTDTDGDGMPDWEEELQGTDPFVYTNLSSATSTLSDDEPYTPPTTITGRFSEQFFEDFMRAGAGRDMTVEEKAALVQNAAASVADELKDTLYTRAQLKLIAANDLASVRQHGNEVGALMLKQTVQSENEMSILQRALVSGDEKILTSLDPIERAYANMITDMQTVSVPTALAKEHLDILNVMSLIHADIRAMQNVFEDPIPALLHVQRYEENVAGLILVIANLRAALESRNIVYTNDEPGAFLFSLEP